MTDMHTDTALRIAQELWRGGMDMTDIWLVGQNMQVLTCDEFWMEMIVNGENTKETER